MISLKNDRSLQKLPKNVKDLGKIIVAKGFSKVAQSAKNRPIWSHWWWTKTIVSIVGRYRHQTTTTTTRTERRAVEDTCTRTPPKQVRRLVLQVFQEGRVWLQEPLLPSSTRGYGQGCPEDAEGQGKCGQKKTNGLFKGDTFRAVAPIPGSSPNQVKLPALKEVNVLRGLFVYLEAPWIDVIHGGWYAQELRDIIL